MRIVVWWCIPCRGIIPIFNEYSQHFGEVRFVVEKNKSKNREKLGWGKIDNTQFKIEDLEHENWESTIDLILEEEKNSIHVFNGIRTFPKIFYALKKADSLRIKYGIYAEAPHNPYRGINRLLKYVYTYIAAPTLNKRYIHHAQFYFVASGEARKKIIKQGWEPNKIIPYGYFTEMIPAQKKLSQNGRLKLLCTGYVTKNKGHILLLKALKELGKANEKYETNITGYGKELEKLKAYVSRNKIPNVNFLGVLPTSALEELLISSDIVVAPGYEEPWGIRVNEAIMYNLPVIVSNGVGSSQVVSDLGVGLVFKKGSSKELGECLKKYLYNSKLLALHREKTENAKFLISPLNAASQFHKALLAIESLAHLNHTKTWMKNHH